MPHRNTGRQESGIMTASRSRRARRLRRAGAALQAALAAMVFVPAAAGQSETPTVDEVLELLSEELAIPAPPSASEHFTANPDAMMRVQEFVRPDLDGDGVEDLVFVFGAEDPGGPRVEVLSGWRMTSHFTVAQAGVDGFGFVVIGVADLDGDGIDDLVVTAPTATTGAARAGSVFVYSGVDGVLLMRIDGDREDGALGFSVASAGDINADGLHDLIIGEPGPETGLPGRAFVFHGRPRADAPPELTTADADLAFEGLSPLDLFGVGLGTPGDIDGDGRDDILIGAPHSDQGQPAGRVRAGEAHLYSGIDGAPMGVILGEGPLRLLGLSVSAAGDFDGDGVPDFAASEPGELTPTPENDLPPSSGRVLIFSGAAFQGAGATLTPGDAIHALLPQGAFAPAIFGEAVELGHDVNGDGRRDLIVTAKVAHEQLALDEVDFAPQERAFSIQQETHVYSGATGLPLYHFITEDGSGRVIEIPYPGPATPPETTRTSE